ANSGYTRSVANAKRYGATKSALLQRLCRWRTEPTSGILRGEVRVVTPFIVEQVDAVAVEPQANHFTRCHAAQAGVLGDHGDRVGELDVDVRAVSEPLDEGGAPAKVALLRRTQPQGLCADPQPEVPPRRQGARRNARADRRASLQGDTHERTVGAPDLRGQEVHGRCADEA